MTHLFFVACFRKLFLLGDILRADLNTVSVAALFSERPPRACGKAGKWEQSLALMDEIESAGMQPGQGCHIMALKACAAAGRWEDTLEMLRRMSERGIDRPENAFAIAMKACGEAGRWREALALMEEMRRDGVLPMETAYCTAVSVGVAVGK